MLKIRTYFLYAFIAWNLRGCQSEDQDNARSVCLLQDPPNQCGEFCLSVLEPLLDHIAKHQEQWNTSDALKLNDTQGKLDRIQTRIEAQTSSLEKSLKKVLPEDFKERLTRMEVHQSDMQKSMGLLLEVQTRLEKEQKSQQVTLRNIIPEDFEERMTLLQETLKKIPEDLEKRLEKMEQNQKDLQNSVKNEQQEVQLKMDSLQRSLQEIGKNISQDFEERLVRIEDQQIAMLNKMANDRAALQETLSRINTKLFFPKFELIGSRYFYIDSDSKNWVDAESSCREMGAHLASIKDQEEMDAIKVKLTNDRYWLGISDRVTNGKYLSVASGKEAPFLKWGPGEPNNVENNEHCVELLDGSVMNDNKCSDKYHFICQSDTEF
ncbi:CD209 antigen-like protein B [Drosophila rhopaloa]|uniref:CD209 antigen-like protein B n=1 Tax=Drosophila rhopaloa TaxID=1041015 RepID=A0A6P4FC01_DRORH|nr:CD209 antigen-like protein B [Drosophila rhopaloa]